MDRQTLNLDNISSLEFLYLVCARAWYDIQGAIKVFEKSRSSQKEGEIKNIEQILEEEVFNFGEEDKNLELLVGPFVKLWKKIENRFFKFGERLTTK